MTALLLEPHPDDAILFAAFTLLSVRPTVVTVLDCGEARVHENRRAFAELGLDPLSKLSLDVPEKTPNWDRVYEELVALSARLNPEAVFAPLPEPGGHEHHNRVGLLAIEIFGPDRVRFFPTYTRGGGRSRVGELVPAPPGAIAAKLRALACYESQIELEATRPWFLSNDLREWFVAPWMGS